MLKNTGLLLPLVVGSAWHWAAARMTLLQLVYEHWVHILVPVGFVFGCYLDRRDDQKLTAFWALRTYFGDRVMCFGYLI